MHVAMAEEEEVKTYSGLIVSIRDGLADEMARLAERFMRLIDGISPPASTRVSPNPRRFSDKVVAAVDGGSMLIPFADASLGIASALAVIYHPEDRAFERRLLKPKILFQEPDEDEGEFMDRLDVERETMVMQLASSLLEDVDVLAVDGPLIPRPKYAGEYVYQVKNLLQLAERRGRLVFGFVKRPQARFLEACLGGSGLGDRFTDRAILAALLERFWAAPWPPMRPPAGSRGDVDVKFTYIRLLEPPTPAVFRVDVPAHLDCGEVMEVLEYVAGTADPEHGVPAMIMKADEEVKMSRLMMVSLYRECFMKVASGIDPKYWSPLAPRWGERLW